MQGLILLVCLLLATPAFAVDAYVDTTLGADCTTSNYNKSTRGCTGTDGHAYNTIKKCIDLLVPGNACYLRGGTYTERIDLQANHIEGAAGNYITIGGYPGETVIIQCADPVENGYGCVKHRGGTLSYGWIIFQDFIVDGTGMANKTGWWIGDNNHDMIIQRVEVRNQRYNGFYVTSATNILFDNLYVHSAVSPDCSVGTRYHGFYVHHSTNVTIRRSTISDMPGIGIQVFPGPNSGTTIANNDIHHNTKCSTVNNGAVVVYPSSTGGATDSTVIAGNKIHDNGLAAGGVYAGGAGGGIRILATSATLYATNLRIENNTIVNNSYNPSCIEGGCTGYGIWFSDNNNGNAIIKNNIVFGNTQGAIFTGTGTYTTQYNACSSASSCGTTGKVTMTALTDCLVSSSDLRLKTGTNSCRDAGTSVLSRPAPVGLTDIGAYEQGVVSSASVVNGYLELVTSLMTPGIEPTSAIFGVTITCVGCTGSPVASTVNVKSGSSSILQVFVSGLTGNGACTVSLGTTNATDSLMIGGPQGTAQGLNTATGVSVAGTCQNTAAGTPPTGLWSHFGLSEGGGTVAGDDSGLSHTGTVSTGVTWVNDVSGTGVTIPTDATYRSVASTYGSGINPTTQDVSACVYVLPDVSNAQKVVFSSTTNGTGQRWYAGWVTVAGQPQWGIGLQGSGFTTGSEFVASNRLTLVCLVSDATTDTATLYIDGVAGALAGSSVKTFTSYTLTGNIIAGNDGTNTVNNGGSTIHEMWVWNKKLTGAEVLSLYQSFAPGGTTPCLAVTHRQFESPYTTTGGTPVTLTPKADGSLDVVPNGSIAIKVQYTCTSTAGATVALRLYYSLDGTNFNNPVPSLIGADQLRAWGASTGNLLNDGVSNGCIDATGLTPNNGITVKEATTSPTFALAQNHCRTDRYLIQLGPTPLSAYWFRLHTDSGLTFANGYSQAIKINTIGARASGGD